MPRSCRPSSAVSGGSSSASCSGPTSPFTSAPTIAADFALGVRSPRRRNRVARDGEQVRDRSLRVREQPAVFHAKCERAPITCAIRSRHGQEFRGGHLRSHRRQLVRFAECDVLERPHRRRRGHFRDRRGEEDRHAFVDEPEELRDENAIAAVVGDEPRAARRAHHRPSVRVLRAAARILVHVGRGVLPATRVGEHRAGVLRGVPTPHVAECGVQPAVAAQLPVRLARRRNARDDRAPVAPILIAVRDARCGPVRRGVSGLEHAGRPQHEFRERGFVLLARDDLDHRRKQRIAGVRVEVRPARRRAQLRGERATQIFGSGGRLVVRRREVRFKPRRVGQQHVQRDRALVGGDVLEEFRDRVGGVQFPQLLEAKDRGGRELFGDRAKVVHGVRVGADAGFAVREAVALLDDRLAVVQHENTAGVAERFEPREVVVGAYADRIVGRALGTLCSRVRHGDDSESAEDTVPDPRSASRLGFH